jgi:hypothetical protein
MRPGISGTAGKREKMDRRGFIKVMAAGGSFALYPSLFSGCSATADSQDLKQLDPHASDIRLKLLSYAMLAPNSHNLQPWLIKLIGKGRFDLYVDQTRLLPETDPPARQIHISQGTFLEYLKIAASGFGYRVEINYFPQGMYANSIIENKPVASVHLIEDQAVEKDDLFPWLQIRQSNKRYYEDKQVPQNKLDELGRIPTTRGLNTFYSSSSQLLEKLGPMLGKAMNIEVSDLDRNKETADIFRFSEKEAIKKRDGFTVANSGLTGFKRVIVEKFFLGSREEAYAIDSAFAKESVTMTYKQAESSTAYGWIVSNRNSRLDQIKSGELYTRINVMTAKLGISQHPLSQILEEYDDMSVLQQEFLTLLKIPGGNTVQMLFRMGYADPIPHTKRRFVKDSLA